MDVYQPLIPELVLLAGAGIFFALLWVRETWLRRQDSLRHQATLEHLLGVQPWPELPTVSTTVNDQPPRLIQLADDKEANLSPAELEDRRQDAITAAALSKMQRRKLAHLTAETERGLTRLIGGR